MDFLVFIMFLTFGLIGVFFPDIIHKKELLTPEKIERNYRIFKRGGIGLIVLALAGMAQLIFWK